MCSCPAGFIIKDKTCICPPGKIQSGNTCIDPPPEDFTLQLIEYIKNNMPINNEIDKIKVMTSASDMANAVLTNGCNKDLQTAKECVNFIPEICSISGSEEYCKKYNDPEFCDVSSDIENRKPYGFSCNRIRKASCNDKQYFDPIEQRCKYCPFGMKLNKDKCENIECPSNEYINPDNDCIKCPFGSKVKVDKTGCETLDCKDDQFINIDNNCSYCPPGSKVRMDHKGCEPLFINCMPDEYLENNICKKCPEGYQLKPDKTGCEKITKNCDDDQYSDSNNNCLYCPPGSKVRMDHKGCEPLFVNCKENEYLDQQDNICKTCDPGFKIRTDKKGCEKVCGDNEYITDNFECQVCGEGEIVSPDKHSCVSEGSIERQIRDYLKMLIANDKEKYKNINIKNVQIYLEEIVQSILYNSDCNKNISEAKNCINNLLTTCSVSEGGKKGVSEGKEEKIIYGFDCKKIIKTNEEDKEKDKKIILIIIGVIALLVVLGLIFKKKK